MNDFQTTLVCINFQIIPSRKIHFRACHIFNKLTYKLFMKFRAIQYIALHMRYKVRGLNQLCVNKASTLFHASNTYSEVELPRRLTFVRQMNMRITQTIEKVVLKG